MSFTVAPTTGFNSFVSILYADGYHTDRANEAWEAALDDAKRAALVKATDYISLKYAFSTPAIVDAVVNPLVQNATAMLALHCLSVDPFAFQVERDTIEISSALEGVGSESIKYSAARNDRFPMVTAMLAPIASHNSASVIKSTMVR